MTEWIECKISDIGTVVGGATPSTKNPENYERGMIAWITPKDLSTFSGRYIERGERNITETGLKSCSTQLLPKNTVLFSSRAPIGYVAIAANEVCTNQGFKSVVPNDNTDPLFLYYLLPELEHQLSYIKYANCNQVNPVTDFTKYEEDSVSAMQDIGTRQPELEQYIIDNFSEEFKEVVGIDDVKEVLNIIRMHFTADWYKRKRALSKIITRSFEHLSGCNERKF